MLEEGDAVQVHGLAGEGAVQYNGRVGTVFGFNAEKQRYKVWLPGRGRPLAVREANLRAAPAAAAEAAMEDAMRIEAELPAPAVAGPQPPTLQETLQTDDDPYGRAMEQIMLQCCAPANNAAPAAATAAEDPPALSTPSTSPPATFSSAVAKLEAQKAAAFAREEYEECAWLRDSLKRLQELEVEKAAAFAREDFDECSRLSDAMVKILLKHEQR